MEKLEREWIEIEHPDGSGGTGMIPLDDFDPSVHKAVRPARAAAPSETPGDESEPEAPGRRKTRKGSE